MVGGVFCPYGMSEVFRRELGVTPSEYRKHRQLNAEQ
jgi:AraC-like DNA-binding protein